MTSSSQAGPPTGPPNSGAGGGRLHDDALPGPSGHGGDASRRALLSTLEQDIIPRLLRAHALPGYAPDLSALTGRPVGVPEVKELVRLLLLHDDRHARQWVQGLRQRGIPVETLFTDLLAMAARLLGELWAEDLCSFADVTVGVGRLQQILRDHSSGLLSCQHDTSDVRRILLLPTPGEQHTFGLVMVAEFFRKAGWDVAGGPQHAQDAEQLARREHYDVVAFSLAAQVYLPGLAPVIAAVRRASLNPHVGILVGGPLFLQDPALASQVGADAVAVDGSLAPEIADKLVKSRLNLC